MISQTTLANILGMTRQNVSKLKKQGMPVDSVESAQAWRMTRQNIAARKPNPQPAAKPAPVPTSSNHLVLAAGLLDIAETSLRAGVAIEAMVLPIQAAMRAVPAHERDALYLPLDVIKVLLKPVLDTLPPPDRNPLDDDGEPYYCDGASMTDADAHTAGVIWYEFACGEIRVQDAVHFEPHDQAGQIHAAK